MSGDAQPRKRRDKRRRKGQVEARRAEEYAEEREILHQLSTQSEPEEEELYPNLKDTDEIIHVYKDANTGGNIVTKIIFFLLMGGIAIMVGFILLEHRGTTDEDHDLSAKETPWSLQFDDWSKLIAVPDLVPDFLKGEQGGHDHHAGHSGEEVDDHGGDHEESGHEDDHGHEEPAQDAGGAGWFNFELPSWGGSSDDGEPAEHEVEEPEVTSSWFSMNYFGGGDEKIEEPVDDHEESPVSEEVESSPLSEEQEEEGDDQEQEAEDEDNSAEDENNTAEEELDEEENVSEGPYDNDDEPLSQEQLEEEEEQNLSIPEEEEEEHQSTEIEENEEPISGEGEEDDDPRGSVFPRRSSIIEEDEAESEEQDEEVESEPENVREASEEELFPEAIEALQREASELIREQKEAERAASVDEELPEEEEPADDQPAEDQEEETEGMALKFGVGVALVVVAHVVLVKKWNSWAEGNEAQTVQSSTPIPSSQAPPTPSRTPAPTPEPPKSETPLADWAEEAIKSVEMPDVGSTPPRTPTPELEEEEFEEESEPEEEEEEDLSEDVPPINPKIYEELIAKYGKPTPESSDAEASDDGNREYSDGGEVESVGEEESGGELEESEPEEEQRWTNVKKPVEVESGSEGEEEEEEEEESDDEPPPRKPPQGGSRSVNEPIDHEEVLLRRQLELADEEFNFEEYYF
ncbi:hypothetical protein GE061_010883 [Apolygus lucorum]|uniref:Uncharacterized protein n=1 Tax=Apolygus lucorum TaxID=248454 RepID=A0A8S9XY26_APOLU|nr:hypothetical protein GE061_010883 [Apolygus lucorum]